MGNCVAVQKNQPASKFQWSPIKENSELGLRPQSPAMTNVASFQELSSKEEIFFDANVWMDSDCEDFFSVNGDYTPSRGTTPIHPNSVTEAPRLDKSLYLVDTPNSIAEPSPTEMKKQLIEFFRESFSDDLDRNQYLQGVLETKPTTFDLPPKPTNESPYKSVASPASNIESTPGRGLHLRRQKSSRSAQCCLPSLVRSLSSSDRKKRPSPTDSG